MDTFPRSFYAFESLIDGIGEGGRDKISTERKGGRQGKEEGREDRAKFI